MARQRFDHSSFIAGRLTHYRRIGWDHQEVLGESVRSLWLMQAKHVAHSDGARGIELRIEQYRKRKNADDFGAPVKWFGLKEGAVRRLMDYLQRQQALEGLDLGDRYVALPVSGDVAAISDDHMRLVGGFLSTALRTGEALRLLDEGLIESDLLAGLGTISQHRHHKTALHDLAQLLEQDAREQRFQEWFREHPWVFGIEYVELVPDRRIDLHDEADIILETVDGYLDIFELKRPDTRGLSFDKSRNLYYFSPAVSLAISQCARYMQTADENRYKLAHAEHLPFLKPRGRIVVGRSDEWRQEERDALRTLNASLHFIEVITFDQVLAMGEQLVARYEADLTNEAETDDIPF